MTIDAHKLHNRSRDRNKDCLIVAMRVANPLLRVLSMVPSLMLFSQSAQSDMLKAIMVHFITTSL